MKACEKGGITLKWLLLEHVTLIGSIQFRGDGGTSIPNISTQ